MINIVIRDESFLNFIMKPENKIKLNKMSTATSIEIENTFNQR